ncbi:MAG: hypothetical protein WCJ64_11925 [Rhodospirillaceae bacterium]
MNKPLKRTAQLAFFELINRIQSGGSVTWRPIALGDGFGILDVVNQRIIVQAIPDFDKATAIINTFIILSAVVKINNYVRKNPTKIPNDAISLPETTLSELCKIFSHSIKISDGDQSFYYGLRKVDQGGQTIVLGRGDVGPIAVVSKRERDEVTGLIISDMICASFEIERIINDACGFLSELDLSQDGDSDEVLLISQLRDTIDFTLGWNVGIDGALYLARKPERVDYRTGILNEKVKILADPDIISLVSSETGTPRELIFMPRFDPDYGGENARLLILLPSSQPEDADSGFISVDNPGRMPALLRAILSCTVINRREMIVWPLLPWIGPDYAKVDVAQLLPFCNEAFESLLGGLPNLEVIILMGRSTHAVANISTLKRPNITLIKTAVPVWPKRDIPRINLKFRMASQILRGEHPDDSANFSKMFEDLLDLEDG